MDKDLNKIIEDSKKDFHKQTFAIILKEWGSGFAKLPNKEKLDTLKEILKLAGISLADSPAGGLAIKIAETRRRDAKKDYNYEFGVTIGAALGLAVEEGKSKNDVELFERARRFFMISLKLKQDKELKQFFDNYYNNK